MNIPADFAVSMRNFLGRDEQVRLLDALESEPMVSIRLNRNKCACNSPLADTAAAQRVPWTSAGFYLNSRPRFTFDPFMHAGLYYVEEPSSMFLEQAYMRVTAEYMPRRVLDLCAAPGGKSTLLRDLMPAGTLLVANEPVRKRAAVLAENMQKWGSPDVVVTCNFPEAFKPLNSCFDLVAADVPCSGEGMFRKDAAARDEWTAQTPAMCAERQRRIISDVWPALCEGGFLVYSTCTFNRTENEDNVRWICETLGACTVPISVCDEWNICGDITGGNLYVVRFFPHRTRGEGFFLALLRKNGTPRRETPPDAPHIRRSDGNAAFAPFRAWLRNADDFVFRKNGTQINAVRRPLVADVDELYEFLDVIYAGLPVADEKAGKPPKKHAPRNAVGNTPDRKTAPSHALALSYELQRGAFAEYDANYADAIRFLRGESLSPTVPIPKGFVLVTYCGVPLGFANNVGTRLNNALPQSMRIRSTYAPATPPRFEF